MVERPLRTKVGSKRIEFEKGKAAIAVGSLEKLPQAPIKAVGPESSMSKSTWPASSADLYLHAR